jgi:predicted RNA-binding protein with PIN domain
MTGDVADLLAGLDARSWARLLRALREHPLADEVVPVRAALDVPTSALASGPARAALCEAIAAAELLRDALRGLTALPDDVRAALVGSDAAEPQDGAAAEVPREDTALHRAGARDRERELRRGLDQARRQRDGAEARALRAEARIVELEGALSTSTVTSDALAARLAAASAAAEQSVVRAERRSAARIAALEADLAAARAALEQQRRDVERDRAHQVQLRGELEETQVRIAELEAAAPREPATPVGRPLVLPHALQADTTDAARWLLDAASLLLVDGYNVTLLQRSDQPLELQRRWLIDRLRPLVRRGRCRPVVVFDGDRPSGATSMTGGVEVRFTGGSVTADDDIVFSVAATDETVVVVTDDRELRARVSAEGANVLGTVHLLGAIEG